MAGGVVNRCHCQLIPDFGLQEAGLGLRELSLCFEHKENGFRAQFILTLLGRKILLREIQRLLTGGKTELRLFQLVHSFATSSVICSRSSRSLYKSRRRATSPVPRSA